MYLGRVKLSTVVLECSDAHVLADFYRQMLGWEVRREEPDWVLIVAPDYPFGLAFQSEPEYVRPMWPTSREQQQMMMHLDLEVADLASATATAVGLGAELATYQPQEYVRVMLDPAGHPFCLWVDPA